MTVGFARLLSHLIGGVFALAAVAEAQVPSPLPLPNLALSLAGEVSSMAYQSDGSLVLVGTFTSIDGLPRDGLARLRPDGSLDSQWYPRVRWTDGASTYAARRVYATPDGGVLVQGQLSHIDGQQTLGCGVKLSGGASPVADLTWHANAAGCASVYLTFDDKGSYYYATSEGVRRGRADTGELDMMWIGSGFAAAPLVYDGHGGLLRQTGFGPIERILTTTGALDTNWQASGDPGGFLIGGVVDAVDGFIYLASSTGEIGKFSLPNGQSASGWPKQLSHQVNAFVRGAEGELYAAGLGQVTKLSATNGDMLASWSVHGLDHAVLALARRNDGGIVAAGNFARIGQAFSMGLAQFSPAAQQPAALVPAERLGHVGHFVRQPFGGIVVTGRFDRANGAERRRLLRLKPDGSLDGSWTLGIDGDVDALAADAEGNIYIGGYFNSVGGYSNYSGLVKIDGAIGTVRLDWNPQFDGRYVQGIVVDAENVYVSSGWSSPKVARLSRNDGSGEIQWELGASSGRPVRLQRVGGNLYVSLSDLNSASVARRISMATTLMDPDWKLSFSSDSELCIVGADDGDLFVGGYFTSVNDVPRRHLARVSSTLPVQVRDWNPAPNGSIFGLGRAEDGRLFASGAFTVIGGNLRSGIAELRPSDGIVLDNWKPRLGGGRMLLAQSRIYLGSAQRGLVAYPLDIGDTIFATQFD